MKRALVWAVGAALAAEVASAQQPATTVQLPTFSFFTTSTTVSVPDQGSVLLGGVNRASSGRNEFGVPIGNKLPFANRLFKNSGIGSDYSASNVRVTATIHDFEAMEEALLGQPATGRLSDVFQPRAAAALGLTLQPRQPATGPIWQPPAPSVVESQPAMSLADAQARRAAQQAVRHDEALDFFERGRKAEAEGKPGVAKIYYQMAARRATGPVKEQVAARLEAIGAAGKTSQVAQGAR